MRTRAADFNYSFKIVWCSLVVVAFAVRSFRLLAQFSLFLKKILITRDRYYERLRGWKTYSHLKQGFSCSFFACFLILYKF